MNSIYKIINKITNDIYIGSALNFSKRKYYHIYYLDKNKHHSIILQNSWNKYGKENFEFIVIEDNIEKEKLIEREQFYIDTFNPKFNCSKTAGSPLGVKHTLQARINMSKSHLGKKLTPESIAKRTAKVLGTKRSEETKRKLRESAYKISVIQCDLNDNIIKEWESASKASNELQIVQSHICACCKGKRKTTGGFKWKYKN